MSVSGNYPQVVLPSTGITLNSKSESCRAFNFKLICLGPVAVGRKWPTKFRISENIKRKRNKKIYMVSYVVELNGPADPIGEWSLLKVGKKIFLCWNQ